MSVSAIGAQSGLALQQLLEMRSQFNDLQQQLSTGLKSDNYAGLGTDGGLTVSLRAQLSQMSSYDDTIDTVSTRIDLMTKVLQRMGDVGNDVKSAARAEYQHHQHAGECAADGAVLARRVTRPAQ